MGFHKSTFIARGANTQLDSSCVSAPPATNVDLFTCFAERLFKSSSIIFHIDGHVIRYKYLTMYEDVAVSCDAYGELYMILNILSGIEPAILSSGHQSTFHRQ